MKKSKETRKNKIIKNVMLSCRNNTNECLILGIKRDEISELLNNFDLKHYDSTLSIISSDSYNSNVYEVLFNTGSPLLDSWSILKLAKGDKCDNLQYEYMIGKFLNNMSKNLPCFIETYHLLKRNKTKLDYRGFIIDQKKTKSIKRDETQINEMIRREEELHRKREEARRNEEEFRKKLKNQTELRRRVIERKFTQKGIKMNTIKGNNVTLGGSTQINTIHRTRLDNLFTIVDNLEPICDGPMDYGLLIQCIKYGKTFKSMNTSFKKNPYEYFHLDVPAILFQIYFCIHAMFLNGTYFVHQDLHLENVLLYKLSYGAIQYEYIMGDRKIIIKSNYIVKLIDYGRSYCIDSPEFFEKIKKNCKKRHGFFLHKKPIDYNHPNVSIDLRLLNQFKNFMNNNKEHLLEHDLCDILKDVVFDGNGVTESIYNNSRIDMKIMNIFDAFSRLLEYIESDVYKGIQEKYNMNTSTRIVINDNFKFPMLVEKMNVKN
jgi:hypothetical protein